MELTRTPAYRKAWEDMVRARAFDQGMARNHRQWHESRGEEATYIGAYSGLNDDDIVAPHFRGICGVALSRGAKADELAKSVFGSPEGTTRGQWRGDICPVPSRTFFGLLSGSLGAAAAYATGAALHARFQNKSQVAVCSFGDGTVNTGVVSEAMNMAGMLSLPVIFICQDNQYATSLASHRSTVGSLVSRAEGFGMPGHKIDGNDLAEVMSTQQQAVTRARQGNGPSFIHAITYRMGGHYMNDPELYRTEEEKAQWAKKDPIELGSRVLMGLGILTPADVDAFISTTNEEIDELVARIKGNLPTHEFLRTEQFADSGSKA